MTIDVAQGHAGHHLGEPGRHRLRHGAQRDAAERDDDGARHLRLHAVRRPRSSRPARRRRCRRPSRRPTPRTTTPPTSRSRSRCSRRRRSSPGRTRPASSTAPRSSATQLNATTTVPGTFVYTPNAGTVLSAGTAQTLSTTFTPTDTANYNTANKSVTIDVAKATPVITWTNPADIVYGTALSATQLNATTTVPGTFVYTPHAGTVLSAGTAQTLSTTFTPTDTANYNTANKSVAINVLKATPVITWANPADIVYGTALERDAAERDDDGARHLRLHAAGDHGPLGRRGADAVDDLHADRRRELQHGQQVGRDQRAQGDAGHHLGEPGRHRLRHGARRDPAERDDDRARHVRLHAQRRHGAVGWNGPDAVDDLHADRRGELQHREQVGDDQRRSRRRRSSPGRTRPTSSTARR